MRNVGRPNPSEKITDTYVKVKKKKWRKLKKLSQKKYIVLYLYS